MNYKWIDISVPLYSGMLHWPGDPDVEIYRLGSISKGDGANISAINFGLHTGTHMDAPLHFIDGAGDIASVDPVKLIGKARVVEINHPGFIDRKELETKNLHGTERVLFKTRNSGTEWYNEKFNQNFVYLTEDGAEYLTSLDVKVIGIDYLSIGQFKNGRKTHQTLLSKEIVIIEGIYLNNISEAEYEMVALPLRIPGADGSPIRVLLKKMEGSSS